MTLSYRPLAPEDLPRMSQWLAAPHVARWWRQASDRTSVAAEFGPVVDGSGPTEGFVVELDGGPIGFIQRYRLSSYPEWARELTHIAPESAVGLDYLIGVEGLTGHGLGPQIIDHLVEDTWCRYPDVEAIVVDVLQENRPSWRALEKAHFDRAWSGILDSDDPSDDGPCYVYLRRRPNPR